MWFSALSFRASGRGGAGALAARSAGGFCPSGRQQRRSPPPARMGWSNRAGSD
jgi:hypothetical protein